MTTRMAGGGPQTAGRRGRAPPDLPSLLLDARIVYIGMALVPEVTELVVSELLWLNYSAPTKPVYIYIQSTGSQTLNGDAVAVEQEAFAIIDTIRYIQPDVYTIAIGQALGSAALVLAAGKKGCRYALPNARVLISPPRLNRTFGRTTNMMIKANELENTTATYVKLLSEFTGMHPTLTREVVGRNRWLSPQDAIDAGVIDKVYDVGLAGRLARERTEFEAMKARRAAEDARARAAAEAQQAAQREQGPSSDV
jgi:ATP-dependent Clp protease protease subunit